MWGVFQRDCYGFNEEQTKKMLVKTFEDYGDALTFAESIGGETAIHLTLLRREHQEKSLSVQVK